MGIMTILDPTATISTPALTAAVARGATVQGTALSRPVALVCLTVQVQGATVRGTALSRPVALVRLTVRVQGAMVQGTALSRPVALVRLTVQVQLFELQLRR